MSNIYKYSCRPVHTDMQWNWLLIVLLSTPLVSCNKNVTPPGTASLTLVHAIVGARPLITNFNGRQQIGFNTANQISYGVYRRNNTLGAYTGNQLLALYQYPDTLDKDVPLMELKFDIPVNSINTLFLTGSVTAPDTMLTRDNLPVLLPADSLIGVRFINLSPGSAPISINIKGNAAGTEVPQLSYKNITDFKQYSGKLAPDDYTFEVRDAANDTLIASHIMPGSNHYLPNAVDIFRNHNFTLALIGLPGGTAADTSAIVRINHY